MELKHMVQSTPNPNAQKFIFNKNVKAVGKASFLPNENYSGIILAEVLFQKKEINQVHFFENVITITKNNTVKWEPLETEIIQLINDNIDQHNIFFEKHNDKKRPPIPKKWQAIDDIINETIRPSLQKDGGDIIINNYFEQEKILVVKYEGACVTCPSSTIGTLLAIKNVLKEQWDKKIRVFTIEQFQDTLNKE